VHAAPIQILAGTALIQGYHPMVVIAALITRKSDVSYLRFGLFERTSGTPDFPRNKAWMAGTSPAVTR